MNDSALTDTPSLANDSARSVVLVVDDEPSICWGFTQLLEKQGHLVLSAASAEEGLQLARHHQPVMVLLDVRLPGQDGIAALTEFQQVTDGAPVIVMTAFGDLETAVQAVRKGASDYLTKPFRLQDAAKACEEALASYHASREVNTQKSPGVDQRGSALIGRSPAMQQVFRKIALIAESELSVLITGQTGTGKELVASAIHRHSRRNKQAYLPIAPVALSPSLLESELFGHVKGAFTGANEERRGLFELADGGTVLLDEIGDLPLKIQVKLLRVLEQGQFNRVGDIRPRRCDVRVIAATNCDLHADAAKGSFRQDLLYRLSAVHIHLPPLSERLEDIPLLCEDFLLRMGYPAEHCAIDARLTEALQKRPWQGNVRELRNAVEHAAVIARGRKLSIRDFPEPQRDLRPTAAASDSERLSQAIEHWTNAELQAGDESASDLHRLFLQAVEPVFLRAVLRYTDGNRAAAAKRLGIDRGTLRERLR
ncbi:MAG: sigma-54 dependent transcriptional regulator, partial [Pirellulaceae bacterium]